MMRTWVCLLFVMPLSAQVDVSVKTPMDRKEYPDSIAIVTITQYDALIENGDTTLGARYRKTERRYDDVGRLTHWLNYSSTGSMYFGYEYEYSPDGKMITEREAEEPGEVNTIEVYDKNEKLIRISSWSAGHQEIEYEYTSSGILKKHTEYRYYGKDDSIDSKVEYEYNEKGLPVKSVYSRLYGKIGFEVVSTTWFTYDNHNNLIERKWTDYHAWVYYSQKYVYNEKGQLVMDSYSASKGSYNKEFWKQTLYEYDERGNLSSMVYRNRYVSMVSTYLVSYNAEGLPIQCLVTSDGSSSIYVWSYSTRP